MGACSLPCPGCVLGRASLWALAQVTKNRALRLHSPLLCVAMAASCLVFIESGCSEVMLVSAPLVCVSQGLWVEDGTHPGDPSVLLVTPVTPLLLVPPPQGLPADDMARRLCPGPGCLPCASEHSRTLERPW